MNLRTELTNRISECEKSKTYAQNRLRKATEDGDIYTERNLLQTIRKRDIEISDLNAAISGIDKFNEIND